VKTSDFLSFAFKQWWITK